MARPRSNAGPRWLRRLRRRGNPINRPAISPDTVVAGERAYRTVYAYDLSGRKTSFKDPDLAENAYVYDSAGRLTKEQVGSGRTAYFAYDRAGLVTRKALPSNEVVSYYSYDVAARLQQLENKWLAGGSPVLLSYFAYAGRNQNGAPTWIRNEGGDSTYYEYDRLDRLTAEFRSPTTNYSNYYGYDLVGNRVLKIDKTASENVYYTYDALNLLQKEWVLKVAPETTYFTYDASQRMATLKIPGGQSSYFTHDQRSQVKKIEFAKASSPDETREFGYSGGGERLSLKVGSGASQDHRLAWDGMKLVTEKNAATGGTTDRRYRHNMSMLDWIGSVLEGEFGEGDRRYFAFDPEGTTRNILQDLGGEFLQDSWIRDRFGKLIAAGVQIGGNAGKLQFFSPVMLDLGLANVQMNPLGPACYLSRWGTSTLGAPPMTPFSPGGGLAPPKREIGDRTAKGLLLAEWFGWIYLAERGGLCGSGEEAVTVARCGMDVTKTLVEHINKWRQPSTFRERAYPRWSIFSKLEEISVYNTKKIIDQHRKLSGDNPCWTAGCEGTVTLGGVCISEYHINHVLMMFYMIANLPRWVATLASEAHEFPYQFGEFGQGPQTRGATAADRPFNEGIFDLAESVGWNTPLTEAAMAAAMSKMPKIIGLKPRNVKPKPPYPDDYISRCKPCTTPIGIVEGLRNPPPERTVDRIARELRVIEGAQPSNPDR